MEILNDFKDENNWIARTFLGRESGALFHENLSNESKRTEEIHFDFDTVAKIMATMYTALAGALFDSVIRLDMSRKQLGLLERRFEDIDKKPSEMQQRLFDAETKSSEIQNRLSDTEKKLEIVPRAILKKFLISLLGS